MATDARKSDFITQARQAARNFWDAYHTFLKLQAEWNGQDYGSTLDSDDFTGENVGLTAANIGAVVFDTANAIKTSMDAGHATNVTNIL